MVRKITLPQEKSVHTEIIWEKNSYKEQGQQNQRGEKVPDIMQERANMWCAYTENL